MRTKKDFSVRIQSLAAVLAVFLLLVACGGDEAVSSAEAPLEINVVAPDPFRDDLSFTDLKAVNEDTIAWVEVPGTVIDYPVMRGVDNEKYLTTTVEGEYDPYGAVFADMQNSDDMLVNVGVLYGHYTPDDTYFTQLHNYEDPTYFAENPDMYLYTPSRQEKFEVVAAFFTDNRNILYDRNYNDPEQLQEFIDWLGNSGDEAANLNLEGLLPTDRFLVLSTCVAEEGGETERYIVVGKMVEQRVVDSTT